ncbi:hypothetical protein C5167_030010 [Papaver somniferum]|nr:hypothetical protein C5167_030010 [Papaver somniferum]
MASPLLRTSSSTSSLPSATSSRIRVSSSTTREGTAKATVNEHLSQAIQSTSNLLQLMQQSSPSQSHLVILGGGGGGGGGWRWWAHLLKLPKNLLAKTATIKNTAQVLEQMPRVISALDAHMESGLQRSVFSLLCVKDSS